MYSHTHVCLYIYVNMYIRMDSYIHMNRIGNKTRNVINNLTCTRSCEYIFLTVQQ